MMEPNIAAFRSAWLARSKEKAAKVIATTAWAEVVSALTAVPTAEAEARCRELRSVIPKSNAAYKTLTNTVSTAFRAIKCGVALKDKYGAVIGRPTIEKDCQIAEAKALKGKN